MTSIMREVPYVSLSFIIRGSDAFIEIARGTVSIQAVDSDNE